VGEHLGGKFGGTKNEMLTAPRKPLDGNQDSTTPHRKAEVNPCAQHGKSEGLTNAYNQLL